MILRVLVVDDSLIFRHAVVEAVSADLDIRVVGSVRNGQKAIEFLTENDVDVVTLDVEMPEMDGLATLEKIQKMQEASKKRIGVLMLSSHTKAGARSTIEALEKGAFDFVTKPFGEDAEANLVKLRNELLPRIKQYAKGAKPVAAPLVAAIATEKKPTVVSPRKHTFEAIVVGVSTGGPRALVDMLPKLCQAIALPILIVQHMPPDFTRSLADSLTSRCSHQIKEGAHGEVVSDRVVYIAPGGRHMEVVRTTGGLPTLSISDGPPEHGCRPAADVLFRSAGSVWGNGVIALVLTGMGCDGTASLSLLSEVGAKIIAQDEATSVVWGMPGSAVATGLVDLVVPLMEIPASVQSLVQR